MANGYTTMYDILKNPLVVRKERYGTTDIRKVIIDGNEFGAYKTFSSFFEKTYFIEAERSSGGVIDNLNSLATFITFHLKVDFAMMSIDDYRHLYDLMLDRNEFTVTAYNVITNAPYTCKMYFAPDQMPKLYTVARRLQGESFTEVLGVQDYTIELIGTNASMDKVEIRYYDFYDNLIPEATQSVNIGTEAIVNYNYVPPQGKRFDGQWQKESGTIVNNGSIITPLENIKLKAVVVPTSQYTLSIDYGIGKVPTPALSTEQINSVPIIYGQDIQAALSAANIYLSDGTKFSWSTLAYGTTVDSVKYNNKDYLGSLAYRFDGWYWTTVVDSSTKIYYGTVYNYELNRTMHQIYTPITYNINFQTNESSINLSKIESKYGEKVVVPTLNKSGRTFLGWYWIDPTDKEEYEFVSGSTMPPFNLSLYAKWEEND